MISPAAFIAFVAQYCPSLLLVDAIEAEQVAVQVCDALGVYELRSTLDLRLFRGLNLAICAFGHDEKDARKRIGGF